MPVDFCIRTTESVTQQGRVEYDFMRSQSAPARVLIVDDDERERLELTDVVSSLGYVVESAEDGEQALEKLGSSEVDAIVTDLIMPRVDGFTLLRTLLDRGDLTPAVVLTGFGGVREALTIVHDLRAFWFLEKPAQQAVLEPLLERAVAQKRLITEAERLQHQLGRQGVLDDLIGTSEQMQRVFSMIQQVAPTSTSVLITGESGTGKERVARAIHRLSPRSAAPFVAINCAAVPESIIESELFGHEKGAFTGAIRRQPGCFEQAHRGTLLLDEIAEMPQVLQAKLLRVLEDSRVRRLGGSEEIPVDVRVLAATNRRVEEAVKSRTLREDLYFRLNVFNIDLPPLRQRKVDIPPLVEALIRLLNKRNDCHVTDLDHEVLGVLLKHSWPGNVRELRNVLERAVIVAREGTVRLEHLPANLQVSPELPVLKPQLSAETSTQLVIGLGKRLPDVEEAYIRFTLQHTNNNRAKTAEILGISLRTLYKRLSEMAAADKLAKAAALAGDPN
jgi:DNA-binding NtrC family response regulator